MAVRAEIRSLTGIRGIAAFLIMLHHLLGYSLGTSRVAVFFVHSYLSVDLFFVLSGFVMALTYASTPNPASWLGMSFSDYARFLGRRLARIYPLYLFASIIGYILISQHLVITHDVDRLNIAVLTNLFLVAAWGVGPYMIGGPSWSISVEFAAYFLFPLLAMVVLFRDKKWAILAAIVAVGILKYMSSLPDSAFDQFHGRGGPLAIMEVTTLGPVFRCLCDFVFGLLAYRISLDPRLMKIISYKYVPEFLGVLIIGLWFGRTTDILIVLTAALFIAGLSAENSFASRLLGMRVPYLLGVYSYSLYLMHGIVSLFLKVSGLPRGLTQLGGERFAGGAMFVLDIVCALGVSVVTYYLIENPGRRIINRMIARRV